MNTIIHIETQEQWNIFHEKMKLDWCLELNTWSDHAEDTHISLTEDAYGDKQSFRESYETISFREWHDPFTPIKILKKHILY